MAGITTRLLAELGGHRIAGLDAWLTQFERGEGILAPFMAALQLYSPAAYKFMEEGPGGRELAGVGISLLVDTFFTLKAPLRIGLAMGLASLLISSVLVPVFGTTAIAGAIPIVGKVLGCIGVSTAEKWILGIGAPRWFRQAERRVAGGGRRRERRR